MLAATLRYTRQPMSAGRLWPAAWLLLLLWLHKTLTEMSVCLSCQLRTQSRPYEANVCSEDSEVFSAALLRISFFWDTTLRHCMIVFRRFESNIESSSGSVFPRRILHLWRHYVPSTCQKLVTQWLNVILQKKVIFNHMRKKLTAFCVTCVTHSAYERLLLCRNLLT